MNIRRMFLSVSICFLLASTGFAQIQSPINIDPFFNIMDVNKDEAITGEEWSGMGLMDLAFQLCDSNKDDKIGKPEMLVCAVPEAMDPEKEGILTIFSAGRFVIPSPDNPVPKPKNAPPGITQATQFVAESPYVEGGPAGEDFIKLFDEDGDGKVGHMEWENVKNNTVFKPFRWPQYNKNRDQWITLDEAPKPPAQ